jgi:excisionase family DNA binding protein
MTQEQQNQLNRIEQLSMLSAKNVLTFSEVATLTGLSKSHLYKLTCKNKIPHYKPSGKMVYFNKQEVETWLMQNRVKTVDEIEVEAQNYCMKNRGV